LAIVVTGSLCSWWINSENAFNRWTQRLSCEALGGEWLPGECPGQQSVVSVSNSQPDDISNMNCPEQLSFDSAVSRIREPMFRISFSCKLSAIREAVNGAYGFMAGQRIESETVTACRIALTEACNNAILYAKEDGSKFPVEIHIACDQLWCELCVVDHTPGFDWPEKPELPETEAERGRGVFLIHSLMDQIVYSRGPGMNRLIMRKKRRTTR